jgi:hypothetical protein
VCQIYDTESWYHMEETIILSDIKYRVTISVNCSDPIVIHNATSYTKKLMRNQEYARQLAVIIKIKYTYYSLSVFLKSSY